MQNTETQAKQLQPGNCLAEGGETDHFRRVELTESHVVLSSLATASKALDPIGGFGETTTHLVDRSAVDREAKGCLSYEIIVQ